MDKLANRATVGAMVESAPLRKDEALDQLAERINVAQFVSFEASPDEPKQSYSRVLGDPPNTVYEGVRTAVERLIERSPEGTVNVRSYKPNDPKSWPFDYGIKTVDEVEALVHRRIDEGLHVIVNETVNVSDGGVSGVVQGGVAEFAPDDTPRCVEKPGTASLSLAWASRLIETVYGFVPKIDLGPAVRLEFSVHPRPRGWRATHTLGWELETIGDETLKPHFDWPNRFSRLIGDKAYGLIMANFAGLPVPLTTVFGRSLAPFSFGTDTASVDVWVRTCPPEPQPGFYATKHGWVDPYRLMNIEEHEKSIVCDPDGHKVTKDYVLASTIVQAGVQADFSGSFNVDAEGTLVIEGVAGLGEKFMLDEQLPENLPTRVTKSVTSAYAMLNRVFQAVKFEWVFDGERLWIVQLHRGATPGVGDIIVPGQPAEWRVFDVADGLEALRAVVGSLSISEGLILKGRIGLTSHMADVVRRAGRPARIEPAYTA